MEDAIDIFVDNLRKSSGYQNVCNQYSSDWEFNVIAANNLSIYLHNMKRIKPSVLLVGEAPGYRGCKLTGIPFVSEKILLSGETNQSILGPNHGYMVRCKEKLQAEASATIMWETFGNLGWYPLLWNAYPFHPCKSGNLESNRPPRKEELIVGASFLKDLIQLFEIKEVYAVGNIAHKNLSNIGMNVNKLRHPSMGGKPEFVIGVENIVESASGKS